MKEAMMIRLVASPLWFLIASAIVNAQTLEEVLTKCRNSVAKISSFEYHALASSIIGDRRFYLACDGDMFHYSNMSAIAVNQEDKNQFDFDMDGSIEIRRFVKTAFDGGQYYYGFSESDVPVQAVRGSPSNQEFMDPFRFMFFWLHGGLFVNRTELLDPSTWDEVAKKSDGKLAPCEFQKQACLSVLFKSQNKVHEVTFCEGVGYLPVRVRCLVGDEQWIEGDMVMDNFIEFREGKESIHFPRSFSFQGFRKTGELGASSNYKIIPGTLNVNQPLSIDLFRLKADPLDIRPRSKPRDR